MRDFLEVGVVRQVKTFREALNVRIGWNSFPFIEQFAYDNVRRLVADAGQSNQFASRLWDFSLEIPCDDFRRRDNSFCLIAKERNGRNLSLKYRWTRFRKVLSCFVFFVESCSDAIHDLVRTLCRENNRSKKLERCFVFELAFWFRICLF